MFFRFFSFFGIVIFLSAVRRKNRVPKSKPDFKTERAAQKRSKATKKIFSQNRAPTLLRPKDAVQSIHTTPLIDEESPQAAFSSTEDK